MKISKKYKSQHSQGLGLEDFSAKYLWPTLRDWHWQFRQEHLPHDLRCCYAGWLVSQVPAFSLIISVCMPGYLPNSQSNIWPNSTTNDPREVDWKPFQKQTAGLYQIIPRKLNWWSLKAVWELWGSWEQGYKTTAGIIHHWQKDWVPSSIVCTN